MRTVFEASYDELKKAEAEIEHLHSDNERLKEWCRKLIEGGTFPGEADDLRSLNAELVAALEYYANMGGTVARAALAKVKKGK